MLFSWFPLPCNTAHLPYRLAAILAPACGCGVPDAKGSVYGPHCCMSREHHPWFQLFLILGMYPLHLEQTAFLYKLVCGAMPTKKNAVTRIRVHRWQRFPELTRTSSSRISTGWCFPELNSLFSRICMKLQLAAISLVRVLFSCRTIVYFFCKCIECHFPQLLIAAPST